ncbi:hypothetical protein Golomagni_06310, partial [Golovinomyces magnicellulatus]
PWSLESHLEFMREANISKSILSITSPGTNLNASDVSACKRLTRECNEYAADIKAKHPDKFGFWASLPLPDVQGSLEEIDYALDVLGADGVVVLTNAQGIYLGDESISLIFEALAKKKAKVFIHPSEPCCRANNTAQPATPLTQYPAPMMEYFFDTTRAIVNLFLSGTVTKYPDVTYIVSHAGGALTPLVARFSMFSTAILSGDSRMSKEDVIAKLNSQFYFDLAGFVFPEQIHGLLPYVGASRITYGSDYPLTPKATALQLAQSADVHIPKHFPDSNDQCLIWNGNAKNISRND